MMKTVTCVVLIVTLVVYVSSTSYFFGEKTPASRLVNREKVLYEAIPWKKRVKVYEYNGTSDLIISAINCFDYQNSDATLNMTEGGIGTNHFTLRMKSQRSYRLDYMVEVYQ